MNPTLTGVFSIFVWGMALPIVRLLQEQIGILAVLGVVYVFCGTAGIIRLFTSKNPLPTIDIFKRPALYGRWIFFVVHTAAIATAISIVQDKHVPFVILLNYFWPTAIILCSVLLAGVQITRWWAFSVGTLIVLGSLCAEIIGADGISHDLFDNQTDCLAYALAFGGAICWGLYSALSRRAGEETGGSAAIPLFQLTLGLSLPAALLTGSATWENLTVWWAALLGGYAILQFIAYLCWDYGMRKGSVIVLSLCADFIPWLSLFSAYVLLQSDIGVKTVFSAITLVIGAMITRYGTLKKKISSKDVPPHALD